MHIRYGSIDAQAQACVAFHVESQLTLSVRILEHHNGTGFASFGMTKMLWTAWQRS